MRESSLELLAPRADVWAFVAEPYHLSDWWPGVSGVEPDRRGLAPGARWKLITTPQSGSPLSAFPARRAYHGAIGYVPTSSSSAVVTPSRAR